MNFRVLQIDHVELFVPNRHEAAGWYQRVLGLEILSEYQQWAADLKGPVMISSDHGRTKLALFEGPCPPSKTGGDFHRVAFRVNAEGFQEFLRRLDDLQLKDHRNQLVTPDAVVDHEMAYSVYFCDPYGHGLEVTTYDYEAARVALTDRLKQAR